MRVTISVQFRPVLESCSFPAGYRSLLLFLERGVSSAFDRTFDTTKTQSITFDLLFNTFMQLAFYRRIQSE